MENAPVWASILVIAAVTVLITGCKRSNEAENRVATQAPAKPSPVKKQVKLSPEALSLQKSLNLTIGGAVTFSTTKDSIRVLRILVEFVDLFLMTRVSDDETEQSVLNTLRKEGLVRKKGDTRIPAVDEHKVLFYSTDVGKQAIVRQIRPMLHIDGETSILQNLVPHVPVLILIDPSMPAEERNKHPFRVLASLTDLVTETVKPSPND